MSWHDGPRWLQSGVRSEQPNFSAAAGEFDGPAGASFDRAKWVADTGGNGFGNQEREFYTTSSVL